MAMGKRVKEIMLRLEDYAVVGEDQTILDALRALEKSQEKLPPDRQPHRAILVKNARGQIVGKLHYFAFLRALAPERRSFGADGILDRAGVGDDLRESSRKMLELFTGDLVDVCERARKVVVRDVYTTATVSIDEEAPLSAAVSTFLNHQTLSLLVTQGGTTVGILRLSDLFDELARQIIGCDRASERN